MNVYRRWLAVAMFVGIGVQWGAADPLPVSLPNLLVLLFVVAAAPVPLLASRVTLRRNVIVLGLMFLLVLFVTATAYRFHDTPEGNRLVTNGLLQIAAVWLLMTVGLRREDFGLYARAGLVSAIAFTTVSAYSEGINFLTEFPLRIAQYEYRDMLSRFYRPIFNAFGSDDALELTGTRRNQFSTSLVVCLLFGWAAYADGRLTRRDLMIDLPLAGIAVLLLLTMFARSTLLIGLLAVLVHFVRLQDAGWKSIGKLLGAAVAAGAGVALLISFSSFEDSIQSRLYDDTFSYTYRLNQFRDFFGVLGLDLLTGVGFYTTDNGSTLHNFILGNWAIAGVPGLVVAAMFYWFVLRRFATGLVTGDVALAALCLPFLVKLMVAGNVGYPELSSLVGVAAFLVHLPGGKPFPRRATGSGAPRGRSSRSHRRARRVDIRLDGSGATSRLRDHPEP